MKKTLSYSFHLFSFLILLFLFSAGNSNAQTTVNINATGASGSFITGSVSAAGVKNDDSIKSIASNGNRGWAIFDLSGIPAGAQINAVNVQYTTFSATGGGGTHYINGYTWTAATDPATMNGAALYTQLESSTSPFYAGAWSVNTVNTKNFNASGISFISSNTGGKVVVSFQRAATNAHSIYGYGGIASQQPKLQITYTVLTPCSGAPAPGNTVSSTDTTCSGVALSLQHSFDTTSGITYQWQSSTDGVNWTNIAGANASTYTATQTTTTYYQNLVTCNNTTTTASAPKQVQQRSFLGCYCIPTVTIDCTSGDHVKNVTFAGINNTTGVCLNDAYSDYRSTVAAGAIALGNSYPLSIKVGNGGTEYAGFWIDYDHSATFDAAEYTSVTGTLTTDWSFTGTVNVPATALTGTTGMRVRSRYNSAVGSGSACSNSFSYGETEDYLVNISLFPLAIKLEKIQAVNNGKQNIISWNSQSEEDGDSYVLERSIDGVHFVTLAPINAYHRAAQYQYVDQKPVNGVNYYRLRMNDIAGVITYSPTVSAKLDYDKSFVVEAYPNPTTGLVVIKLYGDMGDNASVSITDITGKVLSNILVTGTELKLSLQEYTSGIYFVRYADGAHTNTIRVVKE